MVFFFGSSRSRRRRATVTSSHPEASSAASIASSFAYLPVPRNRRERNVTPATTSGSACVRVCTGQSLRGISQTPSAHRGEGLEEEPHPPPFYPTESSTPRGPLRAGTSP